ncbi:ISL3 family transposase [Turicibacter faecis]|uniref:ISL3 family transposase n=2 Tax=Turicibacter faecis TaxID=2963365 RepID=A0ABM8ILI8_9FIRM|nr:ISL3 family transposase [Turicibacter sp. TC023]BEH91595.1 ISL3 family transposase [Turicibacter sp. TC023]
MSHTNCISTLLDLKDKNITFSKNCIQETQIKNVRSKLILGTLSFQPTRCYHCGHSFDSNIIKHGFKTSRIKLVKISGFDAYLDLKKQRYKCRHCDRTFTLETSLVNPNCFISTPVKQAIFLEASHKKSETDIARELNVSHSTVNRVIHSSYEEQPLPFNSLPKVLCFDEFKSVKSAEGAMSFIFCDASNGKLIDIVEDRRLSTLRTYFMRFSKAAREGVTHVVIDMYAPYMTLIKEVFPKAKIVLDKFHIVQLVSRALNKTRIRFMNQNKEFYNKFKHYWRLLLKAQEDLSATHYFYSNCFKKMISQQEIIDFLLALDPELKETYDFYQTVQQAIKLRNLEIFHHAIQHPSDLLSHEMKTALKTLTHYQDYVKNTIETPYTNGVLEGINNNIKVIKRIAFGYRSFYHFKARILIIHKYTFEQKKKRNQAV